MMDKRNLTHAKGFFIRVDEEFEAALDGLRRAEPDLPSKAEMVRRLVFAASAHAGKKGGRKWPITG